MNREKIHFPISRRISILAFLLSLSLSFLLGIYCYMHYRTKMLEHYERVGMDIGSIAASQLNPDRIQHYLDTGIRDEEYERAYEILCDIRENSSIMYLYVVKPELDEVWYVMDTDPTEGAIPLGYHEPYYEGAFKENAPKMARGLAIDPLVSDEEFGWLMSVYYPMRTSEGKPAGYVGVDILMNDVTEDLREFSKQMFLIMTLMALITSIAFIKVIDRTIASPIRRLSTAAEQLVEEEQARQNRGTSIFQNLTIRSRDEIGALYQSLSQMERDMNLYIHDLLSVTAEKERIGAELNVATQIQADMLPRIFPPFPDRHDFDIYATMAPAKEVGGDFYDFFLIDEDHIGLVMADVSGKGVPAALFMVITKTLIKNRAQMGGGPAEVLEYVNEQLCEGNEADLFVTVWFAIVEISTGKGLAANAGHEHPVIRRRNGSYDLVVYRHSLAVAALTETVFREHSFELQPGDRLFVYTDGVPEATNKNNEPFGVERMLDVLNRHSRASTKDLLSVVKQEISEFVGTAPQFDDITMMCFDYYGKSQRPDEDDNTLTIEAEVSNLEKVLEFIGGKLESFEVSPKVQMQIDVAVEEIFVNIASYAYAPKSGMATIRVYTSKDPAFVDISFLDHGVPYNPLAKEDPDVTLSAQERKIGGLGIYMVKKSVDDIRYEHHDGQNILTIRKKL